MAGFIVSLFFFSGCYKSVGADSGLTSNPNNIPPDQTVVASLQGRVIDSSGVPVQGAIVVSGGATTTTDVNGLFTFSNINLSSRWGYVTATKSGYFTGSRSIITNGGASNYVSIQLIPRTETGNFQASSGGTIAVQTGDSAVFSAGSIVTAATNAAYTGTVHVFTKYLDPTDPNLYKYMPGDLRGIGSDGNETALQSFGMLLVELQDDAGNKLQIASGQTAALTWAIPASLQSTAPATIPLWYFNDSTGRWIEQGSAVRQGNSYVGQVSHFTFWNCDIPIGTVNFKVRLIDQHGNPLAYTFVKLVSQNWGIAGGYTDSTGFVQGLIPKGQTLVMQVITQCGNMIGGANVGPALTDQDLGTITVTVNYSDLTLTGTVVDCSGDPVDSGLVNVAIDGLDYRANLANGAFTLPLIRCYATTAPVVVTGLNYATGTSGSDTVTATSGTVDVGQITACGTTDTTQNITFTVGGSTTSIICPPSNMTYSTGISAGTTSFIRAYQPNDAPPEVDIMMPIITGTGNYSIDSIYAVPSANILYRGYGVSCTVTSYGPVFSYLDGSFTGTVISNIGPPQTITGTFHVIRTQ